MNTNQANTDLADLYQLLAEGLAEPPVWLNAPGPKWPLFRVVSEMANEQNDTTIRRVLAELADIPEETPDQRQNRYESLFFGNGQSPLPLYESLAQHGRLITPTTFAVEKVYRAAGLAVAGAERPDHASVELTFLAYLASQMTVRTDNASQWRRAYRLFIKLHAGQWLPNLGDALASTGDLVYKPLGRLLAHVLRIEMQSPNQKTMSQKARCLPILSQPETCTLCGFCAQVCPTRALTIYETDSTTFLMMTDSLCVNCQRCTGGCPSKLLSLEPLPNSSGQHLLHQSPRERCPACGRPTVSQAEINAVVAQIGDPKWLHYCLACRPLVLETMT